MQANFKERVNRLVGKKAPKARAEFLMQNNFMYNEYLGECLELIRWGGQTTVMYEFGTNNLINFIQHWMELNKDNLIWADKSPPERFTLPYIKHDVCPENKKHIKTIKDQAGRIRCAHKSIIKEDTEEFTEPVPDCYSVISDEGIILSLEEILDRLNLEPRNKIVYCHAIGPCERLGELDDWTRESYKLTKICPGHEEENNKTMHPFCGWTLALYVQKWHEQVPDGKAPVFKKKF